VRPPAARPGSGSTRSAGSRPVGARQSRAEPAVGHQKPFLDYAGESGPGRPDGHGKTGDAAGPAPRGAGRPHGASDAARISADRSKPKYR
jgi:hypothetical protein